MSDRAAYSRIYWSVMDDAKFDGIREDIRHFGSWSILLIVADMAWPAPAYVPSVIPRASYRALVAAELVDDLSGGRFRIHGLEAERTRRKDAATRPPTNRPPRGPQLGPNRDPNGEQDETRHRRDEDKTRRDEAFAGAMPDLDPTDRPDLEAFLLINRRAPTPRQRQLLDGILQIHDVTGGQWAADIMLRHPDDPIGAVITADKAYRQERIDAAKAQERPPTPIHRPKARGLTGINAELAELMRQADDQRAKEPA